MQTIKRWGLAGALAGTLAFGGCSTMGGGDQTWSMATSQKIPAATGKVEVGKEKNGNHEVKVEVQHLAKAPIVYSGASTYVVWVKPEGGAAQNVGVLSVDDKLKGELKTKTPFENFQVLVTAEESPAATVPSDQKVMDARIALPA